MYLPDLSKLLDDNDSLRADFGDRKVILSDCLNDVVLYADTYFTSVKIIKELKIQ